MRIISEFKDYYDFIPNIYGIDDKIIYQRIKFDKDLIYNTYIELNEISLFQIPRFRNSREIPTGLFKWLVVCGKLYLLHANTGSTLYKLADPNLYSLGWYLFKNNLNFVYGAEHDYKQAKEITTLRNFCNKLQAPVFTIDTNGSPPINNHGKVHRYKGKMVLDENIPILENIGFSKIMLPLQIYTEIYYYMTNVLRTTPDTIPPVEVSNNDKIVAHGFDLKDSFRKKSKVR